MALEKRQAGVVFRGVMLPAGMTPELAADLERTISAYVDDPGEFPLEFGVRLYEEIAGRVPVKRAD